MLLGNIGHCGLIFPCKFPACRELERETGSLLTASTTSRRLCDGRAFVDSSMSDIAFR
jgi:hypothetical protein